MKRYLLPLIYILLSNIVCAQTSEVRFTHLSISDGLSQVCVNAIIQDTDGYLWFATQDGLNKYNGYDFTIYKPNASNPNSIWSNVVKTIFEDNEGNIWIGTAGGGLSCFNPSKETFINYLHDPFDKQSLSNDDVYAIYQDKDSIFWIGTFGGGLNRFDPKTKKFKSYKHKDQHEQSISGNTIRAISEDDSGNIWIGVDEGGLNKFDRESETFTQFRYEEGNPNSICSDVVLSIHKDSQGKLWIGSYGNGFDVFDPVTEQFIHYQNIEGNSKSLSNNFVWTFHELDNNSMLIGTRGGGLNIFDKKTQTFQSFTKNIHHNASISGNNILSILKDKSGVLWIGTEANGVNKTDIKTKKFEVIKSSNEPHLTNNNIMSILEDEDKNIWLGTRGGGICVIDSHGALQPFHNKKSIENKYNTILSMAFDKHKNLWLGTDGNGFFKVNRQTGEVIQNYKFNPNDKNSLSNNAVTALYVDSDNVLWIGTYGGGLNKYDIEKGKFRNFPIDYSNFMRNVVWNIYEDSSGILWVGTGGKGLMRIDKKTERYVFFEHIHNDPRSISNNQVLSILESGDGTIWVGTGGGGINKFDRENGLFKSYSQKDGLTNDMVLGIVEDEDGALWLSTYNGLSKFDPEEETFFNFYENDGLSGNIFNERSCLKSSSNELFFGSINGLTRFFPDSIKTNSFMPPIVITDFKIFNKSISINEEVYGTVLFEESINTVKQIELSYKLNVFSIEFSSLHFLSPESNKYMYKMEGFDDDWNYTDASKRFATYTNLNGGDYIFKVKGSNSDGIWNNEAISLRIRIIPPFWKQSWFYSIIIILVLISIYLFIKIRERQLIYDKNRLELMVEERTMEINQQKEELKLQSELLAKNNEDLSRTNRLIRDSISYAKRIQEAMLPSDQLIKSYIPESFIFYKPKDIVSGDFYWCSVQGERVYLAVADCTGHGVPGAFMSMIGTTLLNEIIVNKKVLLPSEILKRLNAGVITALNQRADGQYDSQDDGMDITICCIDNKKKSLEIACANHNVYVVNNGGLNTVEGDISSIGGIFSADKDREYTNHTLKLEEGLQIFMFSDGFQDQFGGKRNKKFLASQFKDLLHKNAHLNMDDYNGLLETTFNDWKGDNKQVDDVLVMGIKL